MRFDRDSPRPRISAGRAPYGIDIYTAQPSKVELQITEATKMQHRHVHLLTAIVVLVWASQVSAAEADTAQKGSLLVFPNVEVRWDASGNLIQDTFIKLVNDSNETVDIQMYFVNGDPPLPEIPGVERAHPGWNWIDHRISLTAHQPTYWSVYTGQPAASGGLAPWWVLDPDLPRGRPDPDGSGDRVLRGFIAVWAVDADSVEIQFNHLYGATTVVRYDRQSVMEYPAYAFQGLSVESPGELHLDGIEYEAPPRQIVFDFYAANSAAFDASGVVIHSDIELTLLPMQLDLRQETNGPVSVTAAMEIWNSNGIKFVGAPRSVTYWDRTLVSLYDDPNYFFPVNLQTDKGKARISAQCDSCPAPVDVAMLGVSSMSLRFTPGSSWDATGSMLSGIGEQAGLILYDAGSGPPELSRDEDVDDETDRESTPRWSRVSLGSVIAFPNIEVQWDLNGDLVQDTFISLINSGDDEVAIRLYFVQGDEPLPSNPFTGERPHTGWNWVDHTITLSANQPTYWAASTGLPAGVPEWTTLDPGSPKGRPAMDGSSARVLRGYLWAWAVDPVTGEEIKWDHLSGGATVVNYADPSAWEYDPFTWRVVDGGLSDGDVTGTPGVLNFDGVEFGFAPAHLVLDFFTEGSIALSGVQDVIFEAAGDLTLMSVTNDFRAAASNPLTTAQSLQVWNMSETPFGFMPQCITAWDQTPLRDYCSPSCLDIITLMTDAATARIEGLSSPMCAGSEEAALIGVMNCRLLFNGSVKGQLGKALVGVGQRVAQLRYDPCFGDTNRDGAVNSSDLFQLLGRWGVCSDCPEDLTGDGVIDSSDLFALLGAWGPCG